ncbi:MAG: hypothetical protein V4480_03510 [Patescibacteria group bacterium]
MTYRTYRTSNRHSLRFKMKLLLRRTRTRILTNLIELLDTDTRLAA